MRALLQRVSSARVEVSGCVVGEIGPGLAVLLGIEQTDTTSDADYLVNKIAYLRIFDDNSGRMNRSVTEISGSLLIISQFTLYGDCRKGRRPSFDRAAKPDLARSLYEYFIERVQSMNLHVQTGTFQAAMQVYLVNDGPVTIMCESVRIKPELL